MPPPEPSGKGGRVRIVAGKHRGAKLAVPAGLAVRPTSERAREALFNILEGGRFPLALNGSRVLDLFDGCGEIGRASWRERVSPYVSILVVAVSLKQKTNTQNTITNR